MIFLMRLLNLFAAFTATKFAAKPCVTSLVIIVDLVGDIDASASTGWQFFSTRLGEKTIIDVILLGAGIALNRIVGAVVIGDDQAFW